MTVKELARQQEVKMCLSKVYRHDDILSGIKHVNSLLKRPDCDHTKELAVYPCPFCHGLHVGRTKHFKNELVEGQFEFKNG